MNERIRQLWSQAGGHYDSGNQHTWPQYTIDDPKKFAELIIRECVGIADDYVKDCTCEEHVNCKHPRSAIGRKIREQFGVEE
jgi:hypothetical protein